MFLHIDVAPRSSFLTSQALQLAQEAALTGWVMGSSPQFFGTHGQLGAPAPEPCPWVSSSWIAVTFGVLWERSLFPNSQSGLEGADSKPQEQLTSALSHGPSRPSPCSLPCACGLSSGGGSGRARARLGGGDDLEKFLPLLSGLFVYQRLIVPCWVPSSTPKRTKGECKRVQVCNVSCGIKVSSGAIRQKSGSS